MTFTRLLLTIYTPHFDRWNQTSDQLRRMVSSVKLGQTYSLQHESIIYFNDSVTCARKIASFQDNITSLSFSRRKSDQTYTSENYPNY